MKNLFSLKSGSDVRGRAAGENAAVTPEVVALIGGAFVRWLKARGVASPRIALGRDSRVTGEALLTACAAGCARAGAAVESYDMCTTPAMYMSLITPGFSCDGAIMMTASHHPWDRNGMKFFTKAGGVEAAGLDEILAIAQRGEGEACKAPLPVQRRAFLPVYCDQLSARVRKGLETDAKAPLSGLHVVVDAGNGAGGFYAELLRTLGADVSGSQFLTPDGMFPNHVPNPENADAMRAVSAATLGARADLGVIFDADCDRAAIVDAKGREINRNRLIALISAILLEKHPGATIVTDSVTSTGLARFIQAHGGTHYRFKRGYRNVIDEAQRLCAAGVDCPLAIETSGHAALRENHFLDDGMYLVTVLICEAMRLKAAGQTLSDLLSGLSEPVESAEIRLSITAQDFRAAGSAVISAVEEHAHAAGWHIAPDNREGVRISFDIGGGVENGWFLLRLSVHDPVLPLNLESDVAGGVKRMAALLLEVLSHAEGVDVSPLQEFIQNRED